MRLKKQQTNTKKEGVSQCDITLILLVSLWGTIPKNQFTEAFILF